MLEAQIYKKGSRILLTGYSYLFILIILPGFSIIFENVVYFINNRKRSHDISISLLLLPPGREELQDKNPTILHFSPDCLPYLIFFFFFFIHLFILPYFDCMLRIVLHVPFK